MYFRNPQRKIFEENFTKEKESQNSINKMDLLEIPIYEIAVIRDPYRKMKKGSSIYDIIILLANDMSKKVPALALTRRIRKE
ncbi:hypothetical protein TNIN_351611 [Trichonephila inaurata madagascariensis]|uniref:Uncharacterized protein n=1 Tax=Trichonephila inaurata madagascariensis TaxID=2747483 RepID=A0A8X6KIG2_9ARAC|nr:hypothetical protein TNIN_351611 [Trichonephila inaurata madagascariensis]